MRSLGWASALLVLANLLAILAVFLSGYDWDLDHEFYYGSRLLEGELLWTREFHDKLPMLQMVMAPSRLGYRYGADSRSASACFASLDYEPGSRGCSMPNRACAGSASASLISGCFSSSPC